MILSIDSDLELRQLELLDSVDIFNTIDVQRAYLGKWLPFVTYTKELRDTEKYVASVVNAPKDRFEYIFTIRKQKKFVGIIGFKDTDCINKVTEIGYWLSEEYQKKGLITKSVQKLCDFAFNTNDINRIQIKCAVANKASIQIPRRLGFTFEGIERDGQWISENTFVDLEVYSKLKSD